MILFVPSGFLRCVTVCSIIANSARCVGVTQTQTDTDTQTHRHTDTQTHIHAQYLVPHHRFGCADPASEPLSWSEVASDALKRSMKDKELKRQEMVYELIQTERGFVRHLIILQSLFRDAMEADEVVTEEESHMLFCNLSEVLAMNCESRGKGLHRMGQ